VLFDLIFDISLEPQLVISQNMNCDHIDDLPDEILIEILEYFSGKELKELSLVCKR
jgi:hypothetical protein